MGGSPTGSDLYGNIYIWPGEHIYCSDYIAGDQHIFYSRFLDSCSYCLGCMGLQNKSFCILNKQYSKEERFQKVDEIFSQLEKTPHPDSRLAEQGENALGAFFPWWMNPFYFNDTAAYLIDGSFTKEEVEKAGYLWRDEAIKVDIPANSSVVWTHELDQYGWWMIDGEFVPMSRLHDKAIKWVNDKMTRHIDSEILKKVIRDEDGNVYRIMKMEYDFLQKYQLPLPRTHRLERIKMGFMYEH